MPAKLPPLSESAIQEQIVEYLTVLSAADPGLTFFSVPNERVLSNLPAKLRYAILAMLKRLGMIPGAADLVVACYGCAFFVEVKRAKGKQSQNQRLFQTAIQAAGFPYRIVRSLEGFQAALRQWEIIP